MVCLCRPYHFKFFKDCLPQILLSPFLNTLNHLISLFFVLYRVIQRRYFWWNCFLNNFSLLDSLLRLVCLLMVGIYLATEPATSSLTGGICIFQWDMFFNNLTVPHVFRLFFPVNKGWMRSVNMSSFKLLWSLDVSRMLVQHIFSETSCRC